MPRRLDRQCVYGAHGSGWIIDEYYLDEMLAYLRDRDIVGPIRHDDDVVERLCWPGSGSY